MHRGIWQTHYNITGGVPQNMNMLHKCSDCPRQINGWCTSVSKDTHTNVKFIRQCVEGTDYQDKAEQYGCVYCESLRIKDGRCFCYHWEHIPMHILRLKQCPAPMVQSANNE